MPIDDNDVRDLRVRLCDGAEYLHQLYRVHENTDDEADLSGDIKVWEKIVDDRARRLVAALPDQKR